MIRVAVCGKSPQSTSEMKHTLKKLGAKNVHENPDYVIAWGGDGTLFISERDYPGVPKLHIKDSDICEKCVEGSTPDILAKFLDKKFDVKEYKKLEARIGKGRKMECMNDFSMRNRLLTEALRFDVELNDKAIKDTDVIADGLVFATPYGSTGYYHSIVHSDFDKGFGMAFNNSRKKREPMVLKDSDVITVHIHRGVADFASDNNRKLGTVRPGQSAIVKVSKNKARLIELK